LSIEEKMTKKVNLAGTRLVDFWLLDTSGEGRAHCGQTLFAVAKDRCVAAFQGVLGGAEALLWILTMDICLAYDFWCPNFAGACHTLFPMI
jgi:hypothetical protein